MADYMEIYRELEAPDEGFDRAALGGEFAEELAVVSRLWFACGYRPGITAYLNFFLLREFIVTHDAAYPPRFQSFRSMADSFYQTDVFIRDVTDSGSVATGGISSPRVRRALRGIMKRHERLAIPRWMMTYFGFSLLENVEKQCAPVSDDEKRRHLAYMSKTYRIMGLPFPARRDRLEEFGRRVESAHAGPSPHVERHARNILLLGEMVGVPSRYDAIAGMLPEGTRAVFAEIYPRVRPGFVRRTAARAAGRLWMRRARGRPRTAVPLPGAGEPE
jgi:hypothetical protein